MVARLVRLPGRIRIAARGALPARGSVLRGCLGLVPLLVLLLVPRAASAQIPRIPPPPEWSNSSEFSFIQTRGNTESTTFGLANELITAWEKTETKLNVGALRTRTTRLKRSAVGTPGDFRIDEESETQVSAANYHIRFRGDREYSERSTVFGQLGWTRNTFTGISGRYMLVAGMSTRWVENDLQQLRSSYGLTFTAQDDIVPNPDAANAFVGLQVSGEYEIELTENTEFKSTLVVDENVTDWADLRADWVSTLGVSMNDHFALQAKFQVLVDNQPSLVDVPLTGDQGESADKVAVPLGKSDRVLTMALVVNF